MHAFSLEVMNGIKNSQKKKPVLNKSFIFFRSQQNWVNYLADHLAMKCLHV